MSEAPCSSSSSISGSEISDEASKFCCLPTNAQEAVLDYPRILRQAAMKFAEGASAQDALGGLLEGCSEMLTTVDNLLYQESPLGHALLRKRVDVCWRFIRLAEKRGIEKRVLRHRNSSGHTLLMLAVDLDSVESAPLLERLLEEWPEQVHICYDTDGRNVFHHCAADGRKTSLAIILHWLAKTSRIVGDSLVAAFGVPDGVCRMSPLHHMAAGGHLGMLRDVADALTRFADAEAAFRPPGDFFRRPSPNGLTPLALAEKSGAWDLCSWLRVRDGSSSMEAGATAAEHVAEHQLHQLLEQEAPTTDTDEEEEEDEADEIEVTEIEEPTEAAATELSRLSVDASTRWVPTHSARCRLAAGLARVDGDQKRFIGALMARWPQLSEAGQFLSLSTDPVVLCVSLLIGGGAGVQVLTGALEDIGRGDLVAGILHGDLV